MKKYIYQGHIACKRFGQHFLHDSYIVNLIIAAIKPKYDQAMVEIGPGLGALTKQVAMLAEHMTVIEIDRDLVARLDKLPFLQSRLQILQQDAMKVDFAALANELGQPLRIFGNIPYNISTPLIFHLLSYIDAIRDMHFMLQTEVVNRLVASPNNKLYGRLSVMAQYYCQIIKVLEVPPTSFKPVPKVHSAMVRLVPYATLPYPVKDVQNLATLTSLAFNQRRKKLSNSLRKFFSAQYLVEQGIDATLRAENLSVEQYCSLANALVDHE